MVKGLQIDKGAGRAAVVTYSTGHKVHYQLNTFDTERAMTAKIRKIPYIFGSTNTQEGITVMMDEMFTEKNGDRKDVPNVCIVMTDGISNIYANNTIPSAERARKKGIHMFVIGIGLVDDTKELDGMASPPIEENRFAVKDFKALEAIKDTLFDSFCRGMLKDIRSIKGQVS